MEPKHTAACPEWAAHISEAASGTGESARRAQVTAHLQTCAGCARFAEDLSVLRGALGALPARPTSASFEARLAARLAAANAEREEKSWSARWAGLWQVAPRGLRPALALGAMSVALAGTAFFAHLPATTLTTPPVSLTVDGSLVSHCVEQHRTEAAAQPLSDLSAQNLAAQEDGSAPLDATANAASEDGL